ncbi:MAG: pyruvate ferredoxin oxidoreductase [Candidatus Omnitrophota bacterium]|nr:MAG: pyruvate ferredoxin oxidoreductase [Candidatus Omnitrophota bacterium]
MREVKIYARAGQGAITSAVILGQALFLEGKYSYAFPHFGAARMRAPMNAFLRFDTKPVRMHCQIYHPDYIIIVDPTLIDTLDCFQGFKAQGTVIINAPKEEKKPSLDNPSSFLHDEQSSFYKKIKQKIDSQKLVILSAEEIAQQTIGKPFANTPLLGAFAKATGEIKLESLLKAISMQFAGKKELLEKNLKAAQKGYEVL